MSRLMKQIQEIQEQFSTLFEVEGLGQPAVDVPPSQNKIKKDRKTKDGKVEVVSVEDELFPYEGNKREQYRQKIIDTINNMIQGTATLEDLLQLVRQKKAPLKEAMEVLESLLNEGYNLQQVVARAHAKKGSRFFKGNGLPKVSVSPEDIEKEERLAKILGDKEKTNELAKKALETPDSKEYKKRVSGDARNIFVGGNTDSNLGHADKVALSQDVNGERAEKRQINKSIGRHYRKEQKKDTLKEALELMEAIKDDVKNHKKYTGGTSTFSYKGNDYSYTPEKGLKKEGQTKDDRNPVQKAVDSSNKEFDKARKYNYGLDRQSRNIGKKINKEVAKLEKTEGKGAFPGKTNDTIKKLVDTANTIKANKADADKNFTEINKRQQDMADDAKGVKHQMYDIWTSKKKDTFGWKPTVKTSEALQEAMKVMEEVINEVSVGALARATENNFNKRREVAKASTENAKRAYDNYEKQSKEHPEEEGALYKATSKLGNIAHKDREKASHANDLANLNLPKDSKVPANKLFNAADKTYANRGKEVDKALEKGKGHGDKEFDSSMKKYARAVDLAVADPVVSRRTNEALELVENLYKEINKKFNKGELSVDQALKLEKKVQDKISPEKREKDGKELEAESKTSLEPEIQVNKNLKALRRNDKKRNEGKSNYKFSFDYVPTKEALEEILEDLYGIIQKQPKEKRAELVDKYNTMKQKEGEGTYDRHQKMLKHKSKQEKGQEKTKERSEDALKNYLEVVKDHSESTPSMYQFEALKEAIKVLSRLTEENHHANKGNPVVKITDKNYGVASGKSLPGPFNKNHVGQYIVYNKDTDASYLVTPDDWKKSKIKKDLERQGKFYEALEETAKILELFDRPDLLDEIDTALGSPVKKTFKNISNLKKEKKAQEEVKK